MIECAQTGDEKFVKLMIFLEMTLLVIVSGLVFGDFTLLLIVQSMCLPTVALLFRNPA